MPLGVVAQEGGEGRGVPTAEATVEAEGVGRGRERGGELAGQADLFSGW